MNHLLSMRCIGSLVLLNTLAACGGGSGSTSAVLPQSAELQSDTVAHVPLPSLVKPAAGTIYLGARVNPNGDGGSPAETAAFEAQIGRKLALQMHYARSSSAFPTSDMRDDATNGRVSIISWNCGAPFASIAGGSEDGLLNAAAAGMKAYARPIFLRYMWEMNLDDGANGRSQCYGVGDKNGYFNAASFVAAWRHIHDVFTSAGVTNVVWTWCPDAGGKSNPFGGPDAYYPGDTYVDWTCFDNYDYHGSPLTNVLANMYADLTHLARTKPIMVGETAAEATNQPTFFSGAVSALKGTYPQIMAFSYFDAHGTSGDWRLLTKGIQLFKTFGLDPYMGAVAP